MADILTKTTTRDVTLELLDGSGRQFVVYGLKEEDVEYKVSSPKRRSVGRDLLAQQRRMGRQRVTLQFAIFEPLVGNDGRMRLPSSPSVYERLGDESDPTNLALTAKAQLEVIRSLAKAHEDGTHVRFRGIAVDMERCAIASFNARLVYATGQGTLVLEERPETVIDLRTLPPIPVEAVDEATEDLNSVGPVASDPDELRNALQTDTMSDATFLALVKAHISSSQPNPNVPTGIYNLRQDTATLDHYGLNCLPVPVAVDKDGRVLEQILPRDPSVAAPTVLVLPLGEAQFTNPARAKSVKQSFRNLKVDAKSFALGDDPGMWVYTKNGPSFVVRVENLYLWFLFQQRVSGTWWVEARVYANGTPPTEDYRDDTKAQERTNCAAPAARAPVSTKKGKVKPAHVASTAVQYGQETEIADGITYSFVGVGGSNPFEGRKRDTWFGLSSKPNELPIGSDLKEMALAIAVYE